MADLVVTEVAVPVAKWTLKRLWEELGYMFCYKSNIGDLKTQAQELSRKRKGVEQEVKPAREALKITDAGVVHWLEEADKIIIEEETNFGEETVAAKAACCYGLLPNCRGRFSLGRKAKQMTLAVDQLCAKDLGTIAHPASHPEVEFQPTEHTTQLGTNFHEGASSSGTSNHEQPPASEGKNMYFDSRRSTFVAVMEALRGDQINPIIICGLGGMGKTTLLGQVHEKAKEEGLFDDYTEASCKESIDNADDVIQIQGALAEYLGAKLLEDVKERGPRASKLRERLSQDNKKRLVMLDNVWTTPPDFLLQIGIPPSCKVLVTSRQQDLFKDMDTRKNFSIHSLPYGEAWSLFKKRAGSCIESDPELHIVAEKILKKCDGLPIAISTVGTALKGESIVIWNNALVELENGSPENVDGVIKHVYGPIKFSYESLPGPEAKSCFLMCCIFGQSADIRIEDLVRYGLGLGFFKGTDSMVKGRHRVESLVKKLKSRFLLLDIDADPKRVRMHDVVHDVALHIASEDLLDKKIDGVEKRIVVRDKAKTVKLMGWPKNSDPDQPTSCGSLDISGLCQLLLLIRQPIYGRSFQPPPTIFNCMEDLKVLAMDYVSLKLLVPSLAVLENLHTLRLDGCNHWGAFYGTDVSVIGGLRKLMILSLRECGLQQLPDTFKNLSDLRLLDLSRNWNLKVISPGVISSLTKLEEFYMWDTFEVWVIEKLASTDTTNWISQLEAEQENAEPGNMSYRAVEAWKSLNRLAVEQPAWVASEFQNYRKGIFRRKSRNDEQHTRWANYMDWEAGTLAELLSLSHLTTLEVVLPPSNALLTTTLFNNLERFKISFGWEPPISNPDTVYGNYLRLHDFDASGVVGIEVTSLLMKTNILEFNMENSVYLIDTALVKPATPHSSSPIFPVLNSLQVKGSESLPIRLKEIYRGELQLGSLNELRSLEFSCLPALTYIWRNTKSQSDQWGLLRNILEHLLVLKILHCSSFEVIVAFEYDDEEVINFQSLTELTVLDVPSFTGISKNISKEPQTSPPEDSRPQQSDIIMQPLFDTKVHFPVLEKLDISIRNFKEIWSNQLSAESFCELKSIDVSDSEKLLHLIPTHMQNRLQKLERIAAWYCSSIEEIFESRRLIVNDEGYATALTISESGNQEKQVIKMMSFKQSHQAFQNLTEIFILSCESLRTLLSPSIARGLVRLQKLEIQYCEKIEEIVPAALEGEEKIEDENMFPQLSRLKLCGLPRLGSFSRAKYNFKWPLMKYIKIDDCCNMEKFCFGPLSTPKEVKIDVRGANESVLQELNNSRN